MKLQDTFRAIVPVRLAAGAVAGLLMFAGAAAAGEVAQVPLTVSTSIKPNVVLTVDDSGSMDFEVLADTSDGAFWWNTQTKTFWGTTTGANNQPGFNFNPTGQSGRVGSTTVFWKKYSYLFPNGGGTGNRALLDRFDAHFAVPPTREFAFARSSDYNRAFYNPLLTYEPWPNGGGLEFENASSTAAKSDPVFFDKTNDGTLNLTVDNTNGKSNWTFKLQVGMHDAKGNLVAEAGDETFTYFPATYYLRHTGAFTFSVDGSTFNCASPNPTAYTRYAATTKAVQDGLAAGGIDAIAPDGYCLKRYEIKSGNAFPSGRSYAAEIQNFANWFKYHRKRHLALRNGMGRTFKDIGGIRVGAVRINADPRVLTMWDIGSQRKDLVEFLYNIAGSGGTPNRQAAEFVRKEFDTNKEVIQLACQQNFNLHFTDGFSQVNTDSGAGNADGGEGSPFADSFSNTLADIAMRGYRGPLRTDLARGKVPVPSQCSGADPSRELDCNKDLHINFFGITLGAQGRIFGRTHDTVHDAHVDPPAWGNPGTAFDPVQIDDIYHAAVDGHGEMLNARASDELADTLKRALRGILDRVLSSTATLSAASARLDTGNRVFQASFSADDWAGEVTAFKVDAAGGIGAVAWNSNSTVPAASSRKIFVRGATPSEPPSEPPPEPPSVPPGGTKMVEFKWDNLTPAQQAALNVGPGGVTDDKGAKRVDYLRGSAAEEQRNGGPFRNRSRPLGDIVHSGPVFVHADDFGYDRLPVKAAGRDSYQTFRQGNLKRTPMLYFGANDGMLHALDANTGIETWAFIPTELVGELAQLSDPNYRHRFFVDGQAVAGDAYFDEKWHTILVAPTGAGGKSIVAVDVTDPKALGAGSVKWEFTNPDLGSVIGRPSIVRMANGEWAAMFSNGYDGAGLKAARLFIVRLSDGALLKTISTVLGKDDDAKAQPNGLSPPFPVDGDGDTIADRVYAGDLFGNLWKFNVGEADTDKWQVAFSAGTDKNPQPLITVCASGDVAGPFDCAASKRQPITARPVVGRGPGTGVTVFFGTGKFFETGDNVVSASDAVQSFYGIFDQDKPVAGRTKLTEQTITSEKKIGEVKVRITSNTSVPLNSDGWYMNLVSPVSGFQSERAVSAPVLRNGRLFFTTLIPSADPCAAGGSGWLMALDAMSGGRFELPALDVNGDGEFDKDDTVDDAAVSGLALGNTSESPLYLEGKNADAVVINDGKKPDEVLVKPGSRHGRQSWRQIWP